MRVFIDEIKDVELISNNDHLQQDIIALFSAYSQLSNLL